MFPKGTWLALVLPAGEAVGMGESSWDLVGTGAPFGALASMSGPLGGQGCQMPSQINQSKNESP